MSYFAKKSLGQHFLRDANIVRKIALLAPKGAILEIGPGPGALTRALLDAGADPLIAIEKDERFIAELRALSDAQDGRLHVIEGDALEIDEAALIARFGLERAAIVSNLPYNVGTPLVVKWLKAGAWRGPMLLMFQKEVAERIAARPNTNAYGRLGVLAQARCAAEIVLNVPAGCFAPPPKVDSAVVRLTDLDDPYPHLDVLERVTAAAFGQRRKMLRAALKSLGDAEALCAAAGIDVTARAETLTQAQFRALADAVRMAGSKS